ncbi:hypothetical protein GJ654_18865 [Rhodoblastus acidophilus]|uniref:Uncharacterized protein n=1 Tax=Rhodoblastus acidophilus TaxID=1074 RepID=A0A6N8DT97_RHOAC|nr:hypothetical protein [Rhodoblastus acidophilus]MCW2276391.1 hypothetical protein [Rhodoblastus acidophilus]MTV33046.1 hypothetical protein [Rhodoblastus acidophilus]
MSKCIHGAFVLVLCAVPALAADPGINPKLQIQDGGTNAATAADARRNLGVGTHSVDSSGNATLSAPDGSEGVGKQHTLGGVTPVEFAVMQNGQLGHGATWLCWSAVSTSVRCNYAAIGSGQHTFGNGHGEMLRVEDPGDAITVVTRIRPGARPDNIAIYGSTGSTALAAVGDYGKIDMMIDEERVFRVSKIQATLSKPLVAMGTATGANPSAGNIGELISTYKEAPAGVSLTNNTPTTIMSITLTAGNWDISGDCGFLPANATPIVYEICSATVTIDTPDGPDRTVLGRPDRGNYNNARWQWTGNGVSFDSLPVGPLRVNLTAPKEYNLVGQAGHTGAVTGYGSLRATRVP